MIIPMNLHYGSNASYHEFVFLLQFAAFVAMLSSAVGSSLDVSTPAGLFQMRLSVTITLVVMTWRSVLPPASSF